MKARAMRAPPRSGTATVTRRIHSDEFFHAAEASPSDLLAGNFGKPAFHLIEPGAAGGGEVEMKPATLLGLQPALNRRVLMSALVVQDQVDFQIGGHRLLQLAEEDDKLAASMPGQALTDDLAGGDVECGKQGGGVVPDIVVRLALGQASSE